MLNERIPVTLYERPEPSPETAVNALAHQPRPRRPRWAAASADFIEGLQGESATDPLDLLANVFSVAADAELVCVAAGGEEDFRESLLSGGLTLVVPMGGAGKSDRPALVITAVRPGGASPFTAGDLESAADFARLAHAGLQLERSSTDRTTLAVLADRDRIARELHDRVIQRVFAAGLAVQALAGMTGDPMLGQRLADEVGALDAAIAEIRTAIFALSIPAHAESPSVRRRILDLLEELGPLFPHPPRVIFSGAIDLQVSAPLADDLVAVVREGLTNVARHARAQDTAVSVSALADTLTIEITDNGVGLCGSERCSGIGNLSVRAARWHGTVSLSDRELGGALLLWTARLAEVPGGSSR